MVRSRFDRKQWWSMQVLSITGRFGALVVVLAGVLSAAAMAGDAHAAEVRGGSNFGWFRLNGCERNQFRVVPSYGDQKAAIDEALRTMYKNGQRRLAVEIFFGHGGPGGNLDSTGGDADPRYKANLAALLASIKRIGFEEILIKFLPQGSSNLFSNGHEWPQWYEDIYQEHWGLIKNLRPIFTASGLPYRIDLYSELMPTAQQPMHLRFAQTLWRDYTRAFNKRDTIGFATIPLIRQDRFASMPAVYGSNPPDVLDLHFYENSYQNFVNAYRRITQVGYGNIPWIIGEAYYNDAAEAENLARAIQDTGQRVRYLLQWQATAARACPAVDVAPPLEFGNYIRQGF